MFDNNFFDEWLDEEVRNVQNKIKSNQPLDADDKILLILKAQVNHFHHLDIDMREDLKGIRVDMDDRFKGIRVDMDDRFKEMRVDMDNRFKDMRVDMDDRFKDMREDMDKRFDQVDKRFEQVDKRFEQVDKHFNDMQRELRAVYRAINTQTWKMIGAIGLIVILARLAGGLHIAGTTL
jgi:DNA anti-recombination protein RmuC